VEFQNPKLRIAKPLANIKNMPIEHRCTQSKSLKVPTLKAARNFPGTCFLPTHMANKKKRMTKNRLQFETRLFGTNINYKNKSTLGVTFCFLNG